MVGHKPITDVADICALVVLAIGVQLHEHQHPVGALAVLQPVARGPIAARIGLMNASSGEVDNGVSAPRLARGPRR